MTRLAAWEILRSGSDTPLRMVDGNARARGFDERDRGLLRRIVGTEVRRRGALRAMVRRFARGRPKPPLVAHLHIGLAQLFFLDRVPDHAALSETVDATRRTLGAPKAPYVNGILRTALRARCEGASGDPRRDLPGTSWHLDQPIFRDKDSDPHLWLEDALSIPASLARRWADRHGLERTIALGEWFASEPPLSVRVVGDLEAARAALTEAGAEPTPSVHPSVLRCPADATGAVVGAAAFTDGALTIQGETALAAAELVGAAEGERVLDVGAAPGGKSAVLAGAGAHVVALDVKPDGLERVRETAERLGLAERITCVESDGTKALAEGEFDAVLVDAPCTNTGVLGARPGARWRFGPGRRKTLEQIQERLLCEAAERVRPGGRLVWSTCSLEPEENGQLLRRFLTEASEFELSAEREALPGPDGPIDGGYAARLERRG